MTLPIKWTIDSIFGSGSSAPTPTTGAIPAVLQFHDYLYAVYAAENQSNPSIWQLTYGPSGADGAVGWAGNEQITFGTSRVSYPQTLSGPALAVLGGVLYMAYIDQSSGGICLAALPFTKSTTGAKGPQPPLPSTSWTTLTTTSNQPLASPGALSMVAYPYQGVPSLWIFYSWNDGTTIAPCLAVAQPLTGGTFKWANANPLLNYPNNFATPPTITGSPAAALFTYTNPKTYTSHTAPYIAFIDGGSSDLYAIFYDSDIGQFTGNTAISISKSTKFKSNTLTPKANSSPCLMSLPRIANVPGLGALFFEGNDGESIDLALFCNGDWYVNWGIDQITDHLGNRINPTTQTGCGAALYNGTTIMLIYPGGDPPVPGELYYVAFALNVPSST